MQIRKAENVPIFRHHYDLFDQLRCVRVQQLPQRNAAIFRRPLAVRPGLPLSPGLNFAMVWSPI
jgi:hypothetical protein